MRKVLTVVGARPQFVKLASVADALAGRAHHVMVHTGQHYDDVMSGIFFEDLSIPSPQYNLGVGSGTHAVQTALIMPGLEDILVDEKPDVVVVFGDTNSTLAGALVGAKLDIPVAHVEAGLRSFNRSMPEEINRIIADRVSQVLFCPTTTAMNNLSREGMDANAHLVGDVMLDTVMMYEYKIAEHSAILHRLQVEEKGFYLATIHRASNTDDASNLGSILDALNGLDAPVVFPVHPRTKKSMESHGLLQQAGGIIRLIEPVGYLDMLALEKHAKKVLTDSGGVQKEAYILGTPCVTLREETEWVETLEDHWNLLAGVGREEIFRAAKVVPNGSRTQPYGNGHAAQNLVDILLNDHK